MSTTLLTFSELFHRSLAQVRSLYLRSIYIVLILGCVAIVSRVAGYGLSVLAEHSMVTSYVAKLLLIFLGVAFVIVSIVLQMMNDVAGYVLVIHRTESIPNILRRLFFLIGPVLGVVLWTLLRSYIWVSILGIILVAVNSQHFLSITIGGLMIAAGVVLGMIRLPRFLFAIVFRISEKSTIRQAVQKSYEMTFGYWGKVVGNQFLIALLSFIGVGVSSLIAIVCIAPFIWYMTTQIAFSVPMIVLVCILGVILFLVLLCIFQAIRIFQAIFYVELFNTIKAHPIKKSLKA